MTKPRTISVDISTQDYFEFHIDSGRVLLSEEKYRLIGKTTALVNLAIEHQIPLVVRTDNNKVAAKYKAGNHPNFKCYTADELIRNALGVDFHKGFLVDDISCAEAMSVAEKTHSHIRTGCVSLSGFLNT